MRQPQIFQATCSSALPLLEGRNSSGIQPNPTHFQFKAPLPSHSMPFSKVPVQLSVCLLEGAPYWDYLRESKDIMNLQVKMVYVYSLNGISGKTRG